MSKLWDYLSEYHGLTLTGSEVDDILALARQEIELPCREEIKEASKLYAEFEGCPLFGECGYEDKHFSDGVEWALAKVRNPYPKTM